MQKLAILNLAGESAGKRGYNITQQHTHLVWLHNVIIFMFKYAGVLYVNKFTIKGRFSNVLTK